MTLVNDKSFPMLQYLIADNIHSPEVSAIFSTRNGGVSGLTPGTEHFCSLNLKINSKREDESNVAQNFRIVASSQGFTAGDIIGLRQMHTDKVIAVDKEVAWRCLSGFLRQRQTPAKALAETRPHYKLGEADALVTNVKGVLLSVSVADCVPILLYDSINGSIGAVHAGWRGTLAQIGTKTVQYMGKLYGTNPAYVKAAIGVCCYEVDTGFYEQFHDIHGKAINEFFILKHGEKPYCNLSAMNKAFLVEAGVPEQNIDMSGLCTMCNPGLFYSYRRSGDKRGAMAAFIGMRP